MKKIRCPTGGGLQVDYCKYSNLTNDGVFMPVRAPFKTTSNRAFHFFTVINTSIIAKKGISNNLKIYLKISLTRGTRVYTLIIGTRFSATIIRGIQAAVHLTPTPTFCMTILRI